MSYKTIFTAVTDQAIVDSTVEHAAAVADWMQAHLEVMAFGVDRTQTGYYYAGANAMVLQESLNRATEDSKTLAAMTRKALNRWGDRWAVEEGVAQLPDIGRHVALKARFADLAVLPKPYGDDHGIELEPILESALFEAQVPALIVPDDVTPKVQPERVVVAWNESPEALRAVRAAMPLLKGASRVNVVIIDPPAHGPNRSDPGGMLSQFLSRHGVNVEIDVLSRTLPRVSDVLLRHVADLDAHMVVMGAYGHSRFREAILGGATRHMLELTPVPVFMAH